MFGLNLFEEVEQSEDTATAYIFWSRFPDCVEHLCAHDHRRPATLRRSTFSSVQSLHHRHFLCPHLCDLGSLRLHLLSMTSLTVGFILGFV